MLKKIKIIYLDQKKMESFHQMKAKLPLTKKIISYNNNGGGNWGGGGKFNKKIDVYILMI